MDMFLALLLSSWKTPIRKWALRLALHYLHSKSAFAKYVLMSHQIITLSALQRSVVLSLASNTSPLGHIQVS